MDLSHTAWRKSSHSSGNGECVEVAALPDGPVLRFTAAEWVVFLAGARDGEFDL